MFIFTHFDFSDLKTIKRNNMLKNLIINAYLVDGLGSTNCS